MNYIVVDFEWNQPRMEQVPITKPISFDSEIIEFGAIKLNDSFEPVDEFIRFVKPEFYPILSGRITGLTGISSRDIETSNRFPQVFDEFCAWCGDEFSLMTWGPTDVPVLMDNMIMHGIPTDSFPECYDLQRIFGREIMRDEGQCSLEKAVSAMKITADRAHDALNDARNTAKICNFLNLDQYIEEYRITYVNYEQFTIPEDIHGEEKWSEIAAFSCPYCGETATPKDWIHCKCLTAAAVCGEGDEFYVTVASGKNAAGERILTRTVVEMNDDFWDTYQRRLEMKRMHR